MLYFINFHLGQFRVASEDDDYRLSISEPSGSAGDILGLFNGMPLDNMPFSTADRFPSSVRQMVGLYRYGWWYPLMPRTVNGGKKVGDATTFCFTHLNHAQPWYCCKEGKVQLTYVTMKIRPA